MKIWSFYDPETGNFARQTFGGPAGSIERNTPDGLVAIEGVYDPDTQRVDLETGEVISV
jgi:hypothetical protein